MSFRFTLVLAFVTLTLLSCRREDGDPVSPDNTNTKMVKTAIAGNVTDVNGDPIDNALINIEGKSVKTNQYGTFFIEDVLVPENRCTISCEKEGFFKGFKSSSPKENSITEFRVVLTGMKKHLFSSNEENTIKVGEAQIIFPANGYVYSDGTNYSGIVTAALGYLDPSTPNFYAQFSGDMAARRNDGSEAELYSFGVFRVELFDYNNKPLSLGNSKKASLYYPIAEFQKAHAPEKMPLWFFDETKKIWQEEGEVQKKGNMYIGSVSHFTSWNCDIPTQTAFLSGKVSCDGAGISGIEIRIGERTTITDENGNYRTRVPIGIVFPIEVLAERNDGIYSISEQIGPFTVQSENNHDINLSLCPGVITGKVQCEGSPRGGTIIIEYPNGRTYSLFTLTGAFTSKVISHTDFNIFAVSSSGSWSNSKQFYKEQNTGLLDCGVLDFCENATEPKNYWDLPLSYSSWGNRVMALSSNGSRACINEFYPPKSYIVNIETGLRLTELSFEGDSIGKDDIHWSSDDRYILIRGRLLIHVFDANSGKLKFSQKWNQNNWNVSSSKAFFSHNNTCVTFFNTEENRIEIYNIETGQLISYIDRPDHIGSIQSYFNLIDISNEATIVEYSYVRNDTLIIEEYNISSKKVLSTTRISSPGFYSNYDVDAFTFKGKRTYMIFSDNTGFIFYNSGNNVPLQTYKPSYDTKFIVRSNGEGILMCSNTKVQQLEFPSMSPIKTYSTSNLSYTDVICRSFDDKRFAIIYTNNDAKTNVRVWKTD